MGNALGLVRSDVSERTGPISLSPNDLETPAAYRLSFGGRGKKNATRRW